MGSFQEYTQKEKDLIERLDEAKASDQYIRSRGIQLTQGMPSPEEPFPYLVLKHPTTVVNDHRVTKDSPTPAAFLINPQGGFYLPGSPRKWLGKEVPVADAFFEEEWVGYLTSLVGPCRKIDGKAYTTQPGQPIKVFVIDPTFKDVAEVFADHYNLTQGKEYAVRGTIEGSPNLQVEFPSSVYIGVEKIQGGKWYVFFGPDLFESDLKDRVRVPRDPIALDGDIVLTHARVVAKPLRHQEHTPSIDKFIERARKTISLNVAEPKRSELLEYLRDVSSTS